MGKYGIECISRKGILEGPVVVPILVGGIASKTSIGCHSKGIVIVELIWFA